MSEWISNSLPWVAALSEATSAEMLREGLRRRYPLCVPRELSQLAIVGAAEEGRRLADLCAKWKIEVVAIGDDDSTKRGQTIGGCSVRPLDTLSDLKKSIPVVIASHRVLKASDRVRLMGFKTVVPFALLQVTEPEMFPPHMFYDGWLEDLFANRDRYAALAERLADDLSRRVLNANIGYRMTCDATVLRQIIEWDLYGSTNLLQYGDHEVYIDGGTFDGDSIRLFIDRVGGRFDRVMGFEPDTKTFSRLCANFVHEPRVEALNKGLFSHSTTLHFDNAGTRGSIFADKVGSIEVPVISIDEVLGEAPVTFIKLNIEGAEQPALHGAVRAIKRCAPKLAISVYHRAADLWQIPQLVSDIRPDYQLYLRQHDGGVIETVLYALISED